jgi:multiple sugar transport system substrate-binding protein
VDDLPASKFQHRDLGWKRLGVIFTLSLLTLFYNKAHLEEWHFCPPKTGMN